MTKTSIQYPRQGSTMNTQTLTRLGLAAALTMSLAACGSSGGSGNGSGGGTDGGSGAENGISVGTIDRMGRPGVSTALVGPGDRKDAYNVEGDPAAWTDFTADLIERADVIDTFDGIAGNALFGNSATLVGTLIDDRLQIDTLEPTCDQYLAVEIPQLSGCGGRTLQRDVIDDTLQHLVSQDMPVSDLADNDSVILDVWPFLGVANNNAN